MPRKRERGICELYADDAERADTELFGRYTDKSRRGFLRNAGLAGMSAAIGAVAIPFHRHMPAGLIPAALAEDTSPFVIDGKGRSSSTERPTAERRNSSLFVGRRCHAHCTFFRP